MEKGHSFILKYINTLEDQVLYENYAVNRNLVRYKPLVESLLDWMFHAKGVHEMNARMYDGYKIVESAITGDEFDLADDVPFNEGDYEND